MISNTMPRVKATKQRQAEQPAVPGKEYNMRRKSTPKSKESSTPIMGEGDPQVDPDITELKGSVNTLQKAVGELTQIVKGLTGKNTAPGQGAGITTVAGGNQSVNPVDVRPVDPVSSLATGSPVAVAPGVGFSLATAFAAAGVGNEGASPLG